MLPRKYLRHRLTARKESNVSVQEAPQEGHAERTTSLLRDAESQLATWVSESKAARADAKEADLELNNKKSELLRSLLKQMIGKARAGELINTEPTLRVAESANDNIDAAEGSKKPAKKNKTRGTGNPPPPDPTVCTCGDVKIFCKHPYCLSLHCEICEDSDKHGFESCAVCSGECSDRQASGPYCKRHVKKYLAVCGDCGVVACDRLVQGCQACNGRICTDCLQHDQCERCNYEWQNVRDECGIESDDSYGADPFGY